MKIKDGENIINDIQIIIGCYMVTQNMSTQHYSWAGNKSAKSRLTLNVPI